MRRVHQECDCDLSRSQFHHVQRGGSSPIQSFFGLRQRHCCVAFIIGIRSAQRLARLFSRLEAVDRVSHWWLPCPTPDQLNTALNVTRANGTSAPR